MFCNWCKCFELFWFGCIRSGGPSQERKVAMAPPNFFYIFLYTTAALFTLCDCDHILPHGTTAVFRSFFYSIVWFGLVCSFDFTDRTKPTRNIRKILIIYIYIYIYISSRPILIEIQ